MIYLTRTLAVKPQCLRIHGSVPPYDDLRRGEIAALRWRHIDLDLGQVSIEESAEQTKTGVRYKPPKSGKGRTVALAKSIVEELRNDRVQ